MKKIFNFILFLLFPFFLFAIDTEYLNILNFELIKNRFNQSNIFISKIILDSENNYTFYKNGDFFTVTSINNFDDSNQIQQLYIEEKEADYFSFKFQDYLYLFQGDIYNLISSDSNSNDIYNNVYYWSEDDESIKISNDNCLYLSYSDDKWYKYGNVIFLDNKEYCFFEVVADNKINCDIIGFFSKDRKQVVIGSGDKFIEKNKSENLYKYINPELKRNSININNITFDLTKTDFLLSYPNSRFEDNNDEKDYILDNFDNFDSLTLHFSGEKLSYFFLSLEEKEIPNPNSNIPFIVQTKIKEYTDKYGVPEISEEISKVFSWNEIERKYCWAGEVGIELKYVYRYMEDYGILKPTCEILYTLDSCFF